MYLADLAFLGFKGLLVAFIPLSLIWVGWGSKETSRARRLAWVTVFFTFDLIVFGGFTRLTDSGLGCPDWPGCYAKANPIAAMHDIHAAEAAMPTGPVTMTKAWIEMIHRYLAMGVGVLIIVMVVLAWRRYLLEQKPIPTLTLPLKTRERPWLVTALLGLVCLQGAFGAWTVTMKLQPVVVTTHLLLAMLLLTILVWNAARMDARADVLPQASVPRSLHRLALLAALLLAIQLALGGWVSTNYAVLACTDFPLCQGQLVPDMDVTNGFHLWRELGKTADDAYLPFTALVAIHWVHRGFAFLVFAVLGTLAWQVLRAASAATSQQGLKRNAWALAGLLIAQFLTGIINVVFAWPLLAAVLHNAGAAALVLVLTLINYRLHEGIQSAQPAQSAQSASLAAPLKTASQTPLPTSTRATGY